MCGRYYVDPETVKDAKSLCDRKNHCIPEWRAKDVHPTEFAPVLVAEKDTVELRLQKWGFASFDEKSVIFNARVETVLEKKLFADSMFHTRAAIPASAFYEWDAKKQKWTFQNKNLDTMYLGGFWRKYPDAERFVILTTVPNESMKPIHDRMPLILEKNEVRDWICTEDYRKLLSKKYQELHRETQYEQMSLF